MTYIVEKMIPSPSGKRYFGPYAYEYESYWASGRPHAKYIQYLGKITKPEVLSKVRAIELGSRSDERTYKGEYGEELREYTLQNGTKLGISPAVPIDNVAEIREAFERLPPKAQRIVKRIEVYKERGREFAVGKTTLVTGAHYDIENKTVRVFDAQKLRNFEDVEWLVNHEVGHAIWHDAENEAKKEIDEINRRLDNTIKQLKAKGVPWFKYEKPEWKGRSIQDIQDKMYKRLYEKTTYLKAIDNFEEASRKEGGVTDYAQRYFDENDLTRFSENFAEMTMLMTLGPRSDVKKEYEFKMGVDSVSIMPKGIAEETIKKHPETAKAWMDIMDSYKEGWSQKVVRDNPRFYAQLRAGREVWILRE